MVTRELRHSGIDVVGDIPWGTHFCHFYDTAQDLWETSVTFLKAGLERNERCVWILPEPLNPGEVWSALAREVEHLVQHRRDGRIEVIASLDWCRQLGAFELACVAKAWSQKVAEALERGHAGLRAIGRLRWQGDKEWGDLCRYELGLGHALASARMTMACTYPLAACRPGDVLDVMKTHHFASSRRDGKWEMIGTPEQPRVDAQPVRPLSRPALALAGGARDYEAGGDDIARAIEARLRAKGVPPKADRQFSALFDGAAVGMALFDRSGRLYEMNRRFREMLGHALGEPSSFSIADLIERLTHPDDLARSRQLLEELMTGGRDFINFEVRHGGAGAGPSWGALTISFVSAARGEMSFGVAVMKDITEQKRAEEILRRTEGELAHASRVMTMGEMVASIAHEVNQPLAAVATNASACLRWLARDPPDLGEARAAIESITRDSGRAAEVLERIRALVRKTEPVKVAVDINEIIQAVLALTQGQLRKNGIATRSDLAAGIPTARGDRIQLQQVVLNLVMNGVEAIGPPDAGPTAARELVVRSRRDGLSLLRVEVEDSGRGLDLASASRMFEPFFTTKPTGMGMGLSISRSIIEAHGGRLWATPGQPRGATFQFTLPIAGRERTSLGQEAAGEGRESHEVK
jgi:PAS domain S-box-containing protein